MGVNNLNLNLSFSINNFFLILQKYFNNSRRDAKEDHNHVVSLNVTNKRLLFSSNFGGLENINFYTFVAN